MKKVTGVTRNWDYVFGVSQSIFLSKALIRLAISITYLPQRKLGVIQRCALVLIEANHVLSHAYELDNDVNPTNWIAR